MAKVKPATNKEVYDALRKLFPDLPGDEANVVALNLKMDGSSSGPVITLVVIPLAREPAEVVTTKFRLVTESVTAVPAKMERQ